MIVEGPLNCVVVDFECPVEKGDFPQTLHLDYAKPFGSHDDSSFLPDLGSFFPPGTELVIMKKDEFEELSDKASGIQHMVTISEAHYRDLINKQGRKA